MREFLASLRPHLFFVLLFFMTAALVAHVATRGQGPHGGEVKKADVYFIEMKCVEKKLSAWLLDKKMRTLPNDDMNATADFLFPDSTVMNMVLHADGKEAYVCEVPSDFYSCRISFSRQGKTISAKFASPIKVVRK